MDALLHLDLRGVEVPQVPPELEWDVVALLGWHLRGRKRVAAELLRRYWTVRLLCRWKAVERRRAAEGDEAAALDRGMTWAPWLLANGHFLGADQGPLPFREACEALRLGLRDVARWIGVEATPHGKRFAAWSESVRRILSSTAAVEKFAPLVVGKLSSYSLSKGLRGVAVLNWEREQVGLHAAIRAALLYMAYELWVFQENRGSVYGPEALGEALGFYIEVIAMGGDPENDSSIQQDFAEGIQLLRKDGQGDWIDVTRWVLGRQDIDIGDITRRVARAHAKGLFLYL